MHQWHKHIQHRIIRRQQPKLGVHDPAKPRVFPSLYTKQKKNPTQQSAGILYAMMVGFGTAKVYYYTKKCIRLAVRYLYCNEKYEVIPSFIWILSIKAIHIDVRVVNR